ncbi:MAG: ABC transporter substrate-binding protein [Thermomicrobiales bacterium]|nr:ABC transporter substrate-binding protein [Thermomicrobiales bacterium]
MHANLTRRTFVTASATTSLALAITRRLPAAAQSSPEAGETRTVTHALGETVIPANPERVLALGDEFLLADLIELGVHPVASSSTYASGYVGIDPEEVENLEPFTLWEADLEALLLLGADLVLVPDQILAFLPLGYEELSAFGPVVVLTDHEDWRDNIRELAAVFGLDEEAESQIEAVDASIETLAQELGVDGQTVSVGTIYPGATSIAAWVSDTFMPVEVLTKLGLEIRPDPEGLEVDGAGRAHFSLEEMIRLDGETLIMLQSTVEGTQDEQASLEEVTASPLWAQIPAVQTDRVFYLERVGFPGDLYGRKRILDAYAEIFAPAS